MRALIHKFGTTLNELKKNQNHALLALTGFWILFTLIILVVVIYSGWQREQGQVQHSIDVTATHLKKNLDGLISNIRSTIYAIPALKPDIFTCNQSIKRGLNTAVFNQPYISGISIYDNQNRMMCSTLDKSYQKQRLTSSSTMLSGPLKESDDSESSYALNIRHGHYSYKIFILKRILIDNLRPKNKSVSVVSIIESHQHKPILKIEQNEQGQWLSTSNSTFELHGDSSILTSMSEPIEGLENYRIFVHSKPITFYDVSIQYEALAVTLSLLFSIIMYLFLRQFLTKKFSLKRAIEHGIAHHQFYPQYQPLYDQKQNCFTGVEVLMRWKSRFNETVWPDVFIEEAEKTRLIVPMTIQIAEQTFKDFQDILHNTPHFHLGLNISYAHMVDPDFFNHFESLRERYNIKASQILLEMTEREILSHENDHIAQKMKQLRKKGYRLAIDDFGTGYASLSYLRHFPFDFLKIDKLFIGAIGTGAVTEALNESIIQLAKNLDLKIIAEGVESQVQIDYLKQKGVQLIQGWYYAKAMPFNELVQFLKGVNQDND